MLNFEIKIECKGSAVGTLGWLNEMLSNSELVIKNTGGGGVGLFHRTLGKDGVIGKAKYICGVYDGEGNAYEPYAVERHSKTDIQCVFIQEKDYQCGLFNHPLTPAATEKVDEFLTKCCEAYAQWWESDGVEKVDGDGIRIVIE